MAEFTVFLNCKVSTVRLKYSMILMHQTNKSSTFSVIEFISQMRLKFSQRLPDIRYVVIKTLKWKVFQKCYAQACKHQTLLSILVLV